MRVLQCVMDVSAHELPATCTRIFRDPHTRTCVVLCGVLSCMRETSQCNKQINGANPNSHGRSRGAVEMQTSTLFSPACWKACSFQEYSYAVWQLHLQDIYSYTPRILHPPSFLGQSPMYYISQPLLILTHSTSICTDSVFRISNIWQKCWEIINVQRRTNRRVN